MHQRPIGLEYWGGGGGGGARFRILGGGAKGGPNSQQAHDVKDRIERNSFARTGGWIIGGPKGMLAPPLKLLGGGGGWPRPSSYAYETRLQTMVLMSKFC